MSPALADRLGAARRRAFVGRQAELDRIEPLLHQPGVGAVVYVYGPGGVGKSTLLREVAWRGEQAGRLPHWYDSRDAGVPAEPGLLLLIDGAETLGPPDAWLTEKFLTTLPGDAVAVIAGREPPPLRWRVDPGWRDLVRVIALGNLDDVEGAELLAALGVAAQQHSAVLAYTTGHPLALMIAADLCAHQDGRVDLAAAPQVVTALLAGLLDAVPGPQHQAALEAAAQVRVSTEPLLAALLDVPDARELFDWLRTLSIMEFGPRGLFPHALARDALTAELRWRHPDRYGTFHRRAGAYYQSQFAAADTATQHEILADFAYLHRDSSTLGPFLQAIGPTGLTAGGLAVRPGTTEDHPGAIELVRRHEGDESARIAAYWLERQPAALMSVVDGDGTLAGCYLQLDLRAVTPADRAADPGVAAAMTHLDRHAPLRHEERAAMVRLWLCAEDYQAMSPVATVMTLHEVRGYLTTPDLAVSVVVYADPDAWAIPAAYVDFTRWPDADFTVNGHPYAVFGHDWRVVPNLTWLELLAARETAADPLQVHAPSAAPRLRVLDIAEFTTAVRVALRDLGRPDRLRAGALAQSRLVAERAAQGGPAARGVAVQQLIEEAAAVLAESPRDRRAYRALHHTYLQPAGSQQRAADLLDLPMTTFRRHLAAGIERLTELLWQRELSG